MQTTRLMAEMKRRLRSSPRCSMSVMRSWSRVMQAHPAGSWRSACEPDAASLGCSGRRLVGVWAATGVALGVRLRVPALPTPRLPALEQQPLGGPFARFRRCFCLVGWRACPGALGVRLRGAGTSAVGGVRSGVASTVALATAHRPSRPRHRLPRALPVRPLPWPRRCVGDQHIGRYGRGLGRRGRLVFAYVIQAGSGPSSSRPSSLRTSGRRYRGPR